MPRVLCLHGMGVNANIFQSQTAAFRDLFSEDYEFVFIDALIIGDPAPGIKKFFPGPYRCWYKTPSTYSVAKAHAFVNRAIEKQGPFDAVMGFSQGAAVAASMILYHQLSHPEDHPPLFKAAVFICSPLPFAPTLDHGIDTRTYFGVPAPAPVERSTKGAHTRRPVSTKVPVHLKTNPAYLRGREELKSGALSPDRTFYQMFHPENDEARIKIPTAHIYGSSDEWYLHSIDVMRLCEQDSATVFEHPYGHEIPRRLSEEICDVVETVMVKGGL